MKKETAQGHNNSQEDQAGKTGYNPNIHQLQILKL